MTSTEATTETEGSGPSGYAAARLRLLQQEARSGPPRRAALARLTDDWLTGLFTAAATRTGVRGAALVAVGGYGRGELSPRSDLDLLLLHDGKADPAALAALADAVWYPVWDLGIALDHSVRTPAEARKTAGEDLKVQLGLLDARPVAGDLGLVASLRTAILADWRNQAAERLPALIALGRERAERAGELPFLLEPDLKEARGGLRDATALRAVAASWVADAPAKGSTGRAAPSSTSATPSTSPPDAPPTASPSRNRTRSPERSACSTPTPCCARSTKPRARSRTPPTSPGARSSGSCAPAPPARSCAPCSPAASAPGPPPSALRSPTAWWTRTGKWSSPAPPARTRPRPHPARRRGRRRGRTPALPPPRTPPGGHRPAAAGALAPRGPRGTGHPARRGRGHRPRLEALEAEGIITRLLPDWERVHCRPQRNPVHTWTVDRHLVETAVRAASLTRRVHRPDLLLVAALLHDIGKGWPGDHSVAGEVIARDMATRIGFDQQDVGVIATLVRHHLLLVETATRRDLDDPATVQAVAAAVGSASTLELLHALTEADALATGPAAWSTWRASLVADLVKRVTAVFAGEFPDEPIEDAPGTEHERLAVEALRTGGPVLTLHTRTEEPDGDGEVAPVGVELLIALPDRPGVLPAAAGVLALHRLTVRSADLRALELPDEVGERTDLLLLSWRVAAEYGSLPEAARLRADLVRALDGSLDIRARLAEREAAQPRRRGVKAPPPRVAVAAAGSRRATVIEVRAQDAPGLLHRIGRALEESAVRVRSAHVSTLGANAVDAFYVTGADGEPLPPERAAEVVREVEKALG